MPDEYPKDREIGRASLLALAGLVSLIVTAVGGLLLIVGLVAVIDFRNDADLPTSLPRFGGRTVKETPALAGPRMNTSFPRTASATSLLPT